MLPVRGHIDLPLSGESCDPLCFRLEGWFAGEHNFSEVRYIEAKIGSYLVGKTGLFFPRQDVSTALKLPLENCAGFKMVGHFAEIDAQQSPILKISAHFRDGTVAVCVEKAICFINRDYRKGNFGILLDAKTVGVMKTQHIYTTGDSLLEGSQEVLNLIQQYLPPPPIKILDVGCGLGYYGKHLLRSGYSWLGAEVKAEDCAKLSRQQLPFKRVNGLTLPFDDASFEAAISIEVLEHISDPRVFLSEVRRVSPRCLIVSVPNAELITYLTDYLALPRHMLDSDHKSFFTRWSLGSLLREFYDDVDVLLHTKHPLATKEGVPLFYNLLAIARS